MKSGFHQIRKDHVDEPKATFKTHNGHIQYTVTPFGLTNAPTSFQRLMNSIFDEFLRKFVMAFMDDILLYISLY